MGDAQDVTAYRLLGKVLLPSKLRGLPVQERHAHFDILHDRSTMNSWHQSDRNNVLGALTHEKAIFLVEMTRFVHLIPNSLDLTLKKLTVWIFSHGSACRLCIKVWR